jgi:hypothetical protein
MADKVPSTIALWKPFDDKGTTLLKHDIVCLHTMVGTLAGSWNWANRSGSPYWHFGIAGWGECWQCQDLRYRSAANLEGNPYVIPIETADMGSPFSAWSGNCGDVPAWTNDQVEKIIQLLVYLCARYQIPPTLIPDTKVGRRGIAYHRQGVPDSPEWVSGGLKWTKWPGKCCPDWRRIAQLKINIIPKVREILIGEPEDWLDMATEEEVRAIIKDELETVAPASIRIAEEETSSPTSVYYSDLQSYIYETPNGGDYDSLRKSLLALQGRSTTALRFSRSLINKMMATFPDAKSLT